MKGAATMKLYAPPSHDDEAALVKSKNTEKKAGKSKGPEWKQRNESFRDEVSRLMETAPAAAYSRLGYRVVCEIPVTEQTINLRFSILASRDELQYLSGLLDLMNDPAGEPARERMSREAGGVRLITYIDRDFIEFSSAFNETLTRSDLLDRMTSAQNRINKAEKELMIIQEEEQEARREAYLKAWHEHITEYKGELS